ncbi:hypothetical protein DYB25_012923, partial [Aphanomyces astaci]
PADPAKLVQLTKAWNAIKTKPLVETAMKVYDAANRGKTGYHDIEELVQANSTNEDYVRIAALIASLLDPAASQVSLRPTRTPLATKSGKYHDLFANDSPSG